MVTSEITMCAQTAGRRAFRSTCAAPAPTTAATRSSAARARKVRGVIIVVSRGDICGWQGVIIVVSGVDNRG